MSATEQVAQADDSRGTEVKATESGKRNRKPWLIAGVVALAVALFAGGALASRTVFNDEPDPLVSAGQGVVLQQLIAKSQEADQIIQQVGQSTADPEALLSLAVQLQSVAVGVGDLADSAISEELSSLIEQLSDAYLTIGVGLAINSNDTVTEGVDKLKEAQSAFADFIGADQPAEEGQDQGTSDQGTTDQGTSQP